MDVEQGQLATSIHFDGSGGLLRPEAVYFEALRSGSDCYKLLSCTRTIPDKTLGLRVSKKKKKIINTCMATTVILILVYDIT